MKIFLIFTGSGVRRIKLLNYLSSKNYDVHGIYYSKGDNKITEYINNKGVNINIKSIKNKLEIYLDILRLFIKIDFKKYDNVYFIGFFFLPHAIILKLMNTEYIYDNHDNIEMVFRNKILKKILFNVDKYVENKALKVIVPGKIRRKSEKANYYIVRNTPDRETLSSIYKPKKENHKNDALNIFINGYINEYRGQEIIIELIKNLPEINFNIAGVLDKNLEKEVKNNKNTNYYGEVSYKKCLELYYLQDLCLTLYNPKYEINRYALSNKWNDCLVTNTPFVVNTELYTIDKYIENKLCVGVSYDYLDIKNTLQSNQFEKSLKDIKENIKIYNIELWDDQISKVI